MQGILLQAIVLSIFVVFLGGAEVRAENIPLNEQPMYGGIEKNQAMKAADQKFINSVKGLGISREDAAIQAIRRGFQAVARREYGEAMRRYNQAWLLDPKNGAIYWGFGVVLNERDNDLNGARVFLDRARALLSNDAQLLVDYGRIVQGHGEFEEAINLHKQAVGLDPTIADAHLGLLISYQEMGQYDLACQAAIQAQKNGKQFLEMFFTEFSKTTGVRCPP